MKVKATREGLIGGQTASGYVIDRIVPFVALPSPKALGRFIRIIAPNCKSCLAIVLDVGPWNINDPYWEIGARPLAEQGKTFSHKNNSNGAGIDLGEKVWQLLALKDNCEVEWEFIN